MEFVVGRKYWNGIQSYEVVEIDGDRMLVEIEGCIEATLSRALQARLVKPSASRVADGAYENHCWKCQTSIRSETNEQCGKCKGYICLWSKCGACFCGYSFHRGQARVDFIR